MLALLSPLDGAGPTTDVARDNAYDFDRNDAVVVGNVISDDTGQGVDEFGVDDDYQVVSVNGQPAVFDEPIVFDSGAMLTIQPDGGFQFSARPSYANVDQFTYRIGDGVRESNQATVVLTGREVDGAVSIRITTDTDAQLISLGEPHIVQAAAFRANGEQEDLVVHWESSLEGPVGQGRTFDASQLGVGAHVVSAFVIDELGHRAEESVDLTVEGPPATLGTVELTDDGVLLVNGTEGPDRIAVVKRAGQLYVHAKFDTRRWTRFSFADDVREFRATLLGGDDLLHMNRRIDLPSALVGGDGDDMLRGGSGPDQIRGGAGDDLVFGGAGDDDILDQLGDNRVFGGGGDDTVVTGDGADRIWAGRGNDRVNDAGGRNAIRGERGDDVIRSGNGDDRIWAGRGDDLVVAGGGRNSVHGGRGDDRITTGEGQDVAFGGRGDDRIFTFGGDDYVQAGRGDDLVWAGDGADSLLGAQGRDLLVGGMGSDNIVGGGGGDLLIGGDVMSDQRSHRLERAFATWTECEDYEACASSLLASLNDMDDRQSDSLDGGSGRDLFFGGLHDDPSAVVRSEFARVRLEKYVFNGQNGQQLQPLIDSAPNGATICIVGQHEIPQGVEVVGKRITLLGVGDAKLTGGPAAAAVVRVYGNGSVSILHLTIDGGGTVGVGAGQGFRPPVTPGEPPVEVGLTPSDPPVGLSLTPRDPPVSADEAPTSDTIHLTHVTILNATTGVQTLEYDVVVTNSLVSDFGETGIRIEKGHFKIVDTTILGGTLGIHIVDSPGTAKENRIVNSTVGVADRFGILSERSGVFVLNSLVVWNGRGGIGATDSALLVQGSRLIGNFVAGVHAQKTLLHVFDTKILYTKKSKSFEDFGKFGDGVISELGLPGSWVRHSTVDFSGRASIFVKSGELQIGWNELRCDDFDVVLESDVGQSPPILDQMKETIHLPQTIVKKHAGDFGIPNSFVALLPVFGIEMWRKLVMKQLHVPYFTHAHVNGVLVFNVTAQSFELDSNYCDCFGNRTVTTSIVLVKRVDGRNEFVWSAKVNGKCAIASTGMKAPDPPKL
ncbi:MAG: calcium-binding protein [Pirellulaceae bacterium]|nr:calcium-binding protein [Pirellulaceae bacterium]